MLGIFLDIETTGLDSIQHRSLEIALKVYDLTSGELKGVFQSLVRQPTAVWEARDPTSIAINGFTFEEIEKGLTEKEICHAIIALFTKLGIKRGKAMYIGQNSSFDRGFFAQIVPVYEQERLDWPYHWLDLASMYWAMRVTDNQEHGMSAPRDIIVSKNEIANFHKLAPEPTPHRSMNGVNHLILCYNAVLKANLAIQSP